MVINNSATASRPVRLPNKAASAFIALSQVAGASMLPLVRAVVHSSMLHLNWPGEHRVATLVLLDDLGPRRKQEGHNLHDRLDPYQRSLPHGRDSHSIASFERRSLLACLI